MDRPLRADARRNREAILDAARTLVARDGASVPLDDIARAAGVGPGTVHRHFPTKDALLGAAVVDQLERNVAAIRALAGGSDPDAALISALELLLDESDRSVAVKAALADTEFDLRAVAPAAVAALRGAMSVLLVDAQSRGSARADVTVGDVMALASGAVVARRAAAAGRGDALARMMIAGLFDRGPEAGPR